MLLHRPDKKGECLYNHFEIVEESTGIWPKGYEPIEPPEGAEFIWDTYWELRNTTPTGFTGPVRLSFSDFAAWERVRGTRLTNDVIDAFLRMDATYINEWYREDEKKTTSKKGKAPSKRVRKHGR